MVGFVEVLQSFTGSFLKVEPLLRDPVLRKGSLWEAPLRDLPGVWVQSCFPRFWRGCSLVSGEQSDRFRRVLTVSSLV